jgi:hypothetical protein
MKPFFCDWRPRQDSIPKLSDPYAAIFCNYFSSCYVINELSIIGHRTYQIMKASIENSYTTNNFFENCIQMNHTVVV